MNEWDSRCEKQTNKQKTVRTSTAHEGFHDLSFTLQGRKICSESSMGFAWKPTGRSENWENQNNLLHCQKQGQTVYKIICRSSMTQRAKSISSLLKTRGLPKAYSLYSLPHKPSVSMVIIMPILPRAKPRDWRRGHGKGQVNRYSTLTNHSQASAAEAIRELVKRGLFGQSWAFTHLH